MKPQSAKAKGRALQQYLAKRIVEAFSELAEDDAVSRPMGSGGVDIMLSPLAQKVFPISVEAKNWKAKPGPKEMEQAEYNKYLGSFALVAWKPKGKSMDDTVVMMNFNNLLGLIKRIRNENTSSGHRDGP